MKIVWQLNALKRFEIKHVKCNITQLIFIQYALFNIILLIVL